jgi:hypothetical protein
MGHAYPKSKRFYEIITSLAGWFAIIAQFYLQFNSGKASSLELVVRFFSYFTILTNILVAAACSLQLIAPASSLCRFFSKPGTLTALTVYILIVGAVYNIILRSTWNPEGLQMIVDEILHSLIPAFFVLYWIFFVPKAELKWNNVFPWLIYPFFYAIYIMFRGYFSGFYPYPFVDVGDLGWERALANAGGFTLLFLVTSLFFVSIGKIFARKKF